MKQLHNRRDFLRGTALLMGAFSGQSLFSKSMAKSIAPFDKKMAGKSASEVARDEDYWSVVQQGYSASFSNILILNNGGVSPPPIVVQQAVENYHKLADQGPSYYMWRILDQGREPLRQKLARLAGTDPEEIAINRNATEALNTVIFGMDLQRGDEVIGCHLDYPNMMHAWRQRAQREGIVYKQLAFDFPIEDDDLIVAAYRDAITPRTKVIHVTHVINWVGQIMPVKKICEMAHEHGIEVIVDGAHSFGLLDFKVSDLGCDYFGTSLHKFLSAPVGTGMMWMKREHIGKIWPLVCDGEPKRSDIRKFETLGTRSFPLEQGIGEAINFHEGIGPKRKEERVRYLKDYWAKEAVSHIPRVRLHTSLAAAYSCGICGVSMDGMTAPELDAALFNRYKIHTTAMVNDYVHCVRITPHVYTSLSDLDRLLDALHGIAKS
ncbi:aminotransferase class V-fold PLP-dependent enzyme [Parapedobacter sp. ISTM3]|uniref:aminotransferase class V-fold PLP-dependent enzyme n=1 Tax=Parapedobacter sp. ISTM3 TaxID=2800130 RepID=UPI0019084860|nr:aminotransferase class V-fold PLP-dependent enzyme [Parapedobacter sp. ISTM3]MBK1442415.1 aminotransferase class V-fold PLP-dependent enzyme [Parapedobacter sp. ISTM3]